MSPTRRYGVGLGAAVLLIACGVALLRMGAYGWTLFALLPFLFGVLGSWIFRPSTAERAAAIGAVTAMAPACFLLIGGLEGAICILMSLPLVVPLGALGAWLAYRAEPGRQTARNVTMLLLLSPATLAWDVKAPPPVFEVRTAITVAATPEQVWKHVLAFSELPEPQEWYFRAGLAYPMRARIEGQAPARYGIANSPPAPSWSRLRSGTSRAFSSFGSRRIRLQCTSGVPTATYSRNICTGTSFPNEASSG